ncbi:PLD nuclease N-terminal domain-containing protein [Georgenia sp. TF02-10]|uniref:PLD nuclease N-terminal domain-containing protein n=1 Tax=Georgenia sp. TF02-10 TaxID=2917725 RepID=UPI001FA70AFE|nr:PLD nuclease N-terminal domain-containing protein [Georgenia sp. TF02-10]UNX54431.1 PLD nuclease N-terminal domain-containing protein [Georgenia sp. TF02-10]
MARILPVVLLVALVVYALIDCARTPDRSMPAGIPKIVWIILIVVFPAVGALAWIVVSRVAGTLATEQAPRSRPGLWSSEIPRAPRPTGPAAPDDDPEFLRRLAEDARRAQRERAREVGPAQSPDQAPGAGDPPAPRRGSTGRGSTGRGSTAPGSRGPHADSSPDKGKPGTGADDEGTPADGTDEDGTAGNSPGPTHSA